MDSSPSSIAGPRVQCRHARSCCRRFGEAGCLLQLNSKQPGICCRISHTCCSRFFACFYILPLVDLRLAGFGQCWLTFRSFSQHQHRSGFFTSVPTASCTLEPGSKNSFFFHVCLHWGSVSRLTTRERCSRR